MSVCKLYVSSPTFSIWFSKISTTVTATKTTTPSLLLFSAISNLLFVCYFVYFMFAYVCIHTHMLVLYISQSLAFCEPFAHALPQPLPLVTPTPMPDTNSNNMFPHFCLFLSFRLYEIILNCMQKQKHATYTCICKRSNLCSQRSCCCCCYCIFKKINSP